MYCVKRTKEEWEADKRSDENGGDNRISGKEPMTAATEDMVYDQNVRET